MLQLMRTFSVNVLKFQRINMFIESVYRYRFSGNKITTRFSFEYVDTEEMKDMIPEKRFVNENI